MAACECFSDLVVRELVKGVEICADGAGEKDGILWDDCEARAKVVEADGGDVDAVDADATLSGFKESE